jgi:uncharacterized phage protein (TIGR01671 family)
MRTLKFRIWDGKKMTYPQTVEIGINGVNGLTSGSYQLDDGGYCTSAYVMQFTGLLDKQGKEIYEGDIVKSVLCPYIVTYNPELAWYEAIDNTRHLTIDPPIWFLCEVIGNIYENPELLKGGEKCST